ncbi:MAG: hypothetical protein IJ666_05340 [Ruminococcus sp.]|nr:hypothetical protein [Ruminococcus sp.]
MDAKEYLSQAYSLDRLAYMTLMKAEEMRRSLYGRNSIQNFGAAEKVIDYEKKADETINRLIDTRIKIEKAISAVPDGVQREILERRYLMYQPFEGGYDKKSGEYIRGIAEDMNYSERQIYRLHLTALKYIDID